MFSFSLNIGGYTLILTVCSGVVEAPCHHCIVVAVAKQREQFVPTETYSSSPEDVYSSGTEMTLDTDTEAAGNGSEDADTNRSTLRNTFLLIPNAAGDGR